MQMDQATRKAALERLNVFIGEWRMEASFPLAAPASIAGRAVVGRALFEWELGGQFLTQYEEFPDPDLPDSSAIIGFDPDSQAYTQHYFDSRGVARVYAMTLGEGVWTLLREEARLHAARLLAALHGHVPRRRQDHHRPLGVGQRRLELEARLQPHLHEGKLAVAAQSRRRRSQMTKVIFDMSMSLDGYMTASGVRPEEPMGDGGQRLHEWAFDAGDERSANVLAEMSSSVGAGITGRRTYDLSVPWWGPDGPSGSIRTPLFVVSHAEPEQVPDGGVYTFVDSPEEAVEQARATAGEKDVDIIGGDIGQQLIRAGLVDEIHVHLVPVLFGAGSRLFENLGDDHIQLEAPRVTEGSKATHLRYRVVKRA